MESITNIFHSWILDETEEYCPSLLQSTITKKPHNYYAFIWPKPSQISTEFLST